MALWRATEGCEEGFQLFDEWSSRGRHYGGTRERWEALEGSPPDHIGAGTIFHMAKEAAPGWRQCALEARAAALIAARPAALYRVGDDIFDMSEVAEKLRQATGAVR